MADARIQDEIDRIDMAARDPHFVRGLGTPSYYEIGYFRSDAMTPEGLERIEKHERIVAGWREAGLVPPRTWTWFSLPPPDAG